MLNFVSGTGKLSFTTNSNFIFLLNPSLCVFLLLFNIFEPANTWLFTCWLILKREMTLLIFRGLSTEAKASQVNSKFQWWFSLQIVMKLSSTSITCQFYTLPQLKWSYQSKMLTWLIESGLSGDFVCSSYLLKSMDWFIYDRDLRYEKVKEYRR